MKIKFWGVRGSIPNPDRNVLNYGGNTLCIEVKTSDKHVFILDAGTGIIPLGNELMKREFSSGKGKAVLLISHSHWDHIQGFPFMVPLFIKGNELAVYGPLTHGNTIEEIFEGEMNPHYSPIYSLSNYSATLKFHTMNDKEFHIIEQTKITNRFFHHSSIPTVSYSIERDNKKVVYLTDIEYIEEKQFSEVAEFIHDADLLIHDTMYYSNEIEKYRTWGHSCLDEAIKVCKLANVKRLATYHYNPDHSDEFIDNYIKEAQQKIIDENIPLTLIASKELDEYEI